jgi:hypothetical protein
MSIEFTRTSRRLGILSAVIVVTLGVVYLITLALGFLSLDSSTQPIVDPLFSILEVLIILMMPAMLALMAAVHSWGRPETKVFSLIALVFMGLLACITSSLHFVILIMSGQAAFREMQALFSFKWPSIAYALDILSWDVFFALAMLFAAPIFAGSRLAVSIRLLMIASAVLALAGLSGVVFGDMRLRNIGIVGYDGIFLVVAALLAILFYRTEVV